MITVSLVCYKTRIEELTQILSKTTIDNNIVAIYIIDNSPTDVLRSLIEGYNSKVIYIYNNANLGYGKAHNIGIKRAMEIGSKYHLVMNTDISFYIDAIEKLAIYMENNNDVGLLVPKIVDQQGNLQYLCKLLPTPIDLFGRRFFPNLSYFRKRNINFELRGKDYNKIMNIPFLSGCFMFFNVEALRKVGLFDDQFFMYCEDIDLCRRIHQKYRTLHYPDVEVVHVHAKSSYRNIKMFKAHINSAIHYFNKWGWLFDMERRNINKQATDS